MLLDCQIVALRFSGYGLSLHWCRLASYRLGMQLCLRSYWRDNLCKLHLYAADGVPSLHLGIQNTPRCLRLYRSFIGGDTWLELKFT